MELIRELFLEHSVTQSILLLTMVVFLGLWAGERLRIKNFTFGVTWILFVGIALSSFGITIDPEVSSFAKNLGLILFIYSIGLQVGPSFSPFGKSGLRLNLLAVAIVLLGCVITVVSHSKLCLELSEGLDCYTNYDKKSSTTEGKYACKIRCILCCVGLCHLLSVLKRLCVVAE